VTFNYININEKIPFVILAGNIVWNSNDFLLLKMPNMARSIEKSPEQANLNIKQTYLQNRIQSISK
jgi:hypothetical protein